MTTALDHINRAIQFIERHDGWVLHPGQDLHGWLLQARDAILTPEPVATTPAFKVGDRVRIARQVEQDGCEWFRIRMLDAYKPGGED